MTRISDLIAQYETEYLERYHAQILPAHLRALQAMKACRNALSQKMLTECPDCNHWQVVPHSCGHRNCPHCQQYESQQWLERQLQKQVATDYFLLTFTLPAQLRGLVWRHQQELYALMMRCAWETVQTFSRNDKHLRGTPGAIAVLHTHSRRLDYHPHIHLAMPAAAINAEDKCWRTKVSKANVKQGYLFSHTALAKVFRAKLLAAITAAGLILPDHYPQQWVVDCKAVGSGQAVLTYLGRYLYRGVIQEKDIVANQDGKVTFRYQNAKTGKAEFRTLPGAAFLRLILMHVLPRGFRRARNYGFLHPNSKRLIALLQHLRKIIPRRADFVPVTRPRVKCRCCGAEMRVVQTRLSSVFQGRSETPHEAVEVPGM
jgi:hypothetical protein